MRKRVHLFLNDEESEEALINLTPLIDVVFVVLISFMLIAPILSTDSVQLTKGSSTSAATNPVSQDQKILISIRSNNEIRFKEKQVSLPELKTLLLIEKKNKSQMIPQVIPDAHSHFETYQQVKIILEECGFEQMEILLKPA